MFFASDNTGPVAPEIMEAIAQANQGYALGYARDDSADLVQTRLREVFEAPEAAVHLVISGTAANALALATLSNPWEAVFCHKIAHVQVSEANAPEFYSGGAKMVGVSGTNGKMDPAALIDAIEDYESGGVKEVQRGPVTITQVTDEGAVHSLDEVRALSDVAKRYGLPCHMDGARFANALVALGCSPAEMSWKLGIDALSFGGTKNGAMGVEAVIFFDPKKSREFQLRRMRAGHMLSKHRYLAAQMLAYLKDDLWLRLATRSNAMAAKLDRAVGDLPMGRVRIPRDANMIFAEWSRAGHHKAQAAGAQYYLGHRQSLEGPPDEPVSARLVTNWATTDQDIADFVRAVTTGKAST
jgi:threonine aldolase